MKKPVEQAVQISAAPTQAAQGGFQQLRQILAVAGSIIGSAKQQKVGQLLRQVVAAGAGCK